MTINTMEENKNTNNIISILGTIYKLYRESKDNWRFVDGIQGRCDSYLKEIYICKQERSYIDKEKPDKWLFLNEAEILHHEIVHAYLNECGLKYNTHSSQAWAENEEMIDWIASMATTISMTFFEADHWLSEFFDLK